MRNAQILGNSGTFPISIVLCMFRAVSPFYLYFVVYNIYTRICIIATHPFASRAHRDKRKSYLFITRRVHLPSRFQQIIGEKQW